MKIFISSQQTQDFAKEILKLAKKENINLVLLQGDLGSGKTTFVQGLGKALGIKNNIPSPTFILMREYKVLNSDKFDRLYHIDLYRVDKSFDLEELGFNELLNGDDLIVIEWPERVRLDWPRPHLLLRFEYIDETKRKIEDKIVKQALRSLKH